MSNDLIPVTKGQFVRENKKTGLLEVVDEKTGEVIARQGTLNEYRSKLKYPFDRTIADLICNRIMEGDTLSAIGDDPTMPDTSDIARWRRNDEDFEKALQQARKDRAHYYHDKAISIAEDTQTKDEVSVNKLKSETYKWAAERGNSDAYGARPTKVEGVSVSTQIIVTGVPQPVSVDSEPIDITPDAETGGSEVVNEAAPELEDANAAIAGGSESEPSIID